MKSFVRWTSMAIVLLTLSAFGNFASADTAGSGSEKQKAILVTGASTGIGRKIAEVLADKGFLVYAGARKQSDLDDLNKIHNIKAIRLDVTDQAEINAAVATVKAGGLGLYGLVNNAGVFSGGPMIEVPVSELQWLMDVNVYGVYRVTQAFAPMLIESKGRITTVGSIAGTLSGKYSGLYSMSKHAIEAYTDSLAKELEMLDVQVSVIEPGNYDSKIGESARDRLLEKEIAKEHSYFAEDMKKWLDEPWSRSQYKEPDEVAEAAVDVFTSDKPLRRYMVVPEEREAGWTIDKQIEELVQLNQWQAYSYTREQLIEKLDKALAAQKK